MLVITRGYTTGKVLTKDAQHQSSSKFVQGAEVQAALLETRDSRAKVSRRPWLEIISAARNPIIIIGTVQQLNFKHLSHVQTCYIYIYTMCVCVYMCGCVHVYIYIYTYIYLFIIIYIYVCVCVYHLCVCLLRIYIYILIHLCICIFIDRYIHR